MALRQPSQTNTLPQKVSAEEDTQQRGYARKGILAAWAAEAKGMEVEMWKIHSRVECGRE